MIDNSLVTEGGGTVTKLTHDKYTEAPRKRAPAREKVPRPTFLQAAEKVMRQHADALRELAKH